MSQQSRKSSEISKMLNNYWFKLGTKVTRKPCNWKTILATYALSIPMAVIIFQLKTNNSFMDIVPRGTPSSVTMDMMAEDFPPGKINPVTMAIGCNDESSDCLLSEPTPLPDPDTSDG